MFSPRGRIFVSLAAFASNIGPFIFFCGGSVIGVGLTADYIINIYILLNFI
jgi:hypothetical protein